MFRTEILLDGVCYRIFGTYEEAVEGAREVAQMAGVNSSGDEHKLSEALMDDWRVAWVDIAIPATKTDYPSCPECDLQGSFNTGDGSTWCDACGYDSEEEQ